jgi:acetyl-CoA carboxylase biotin carboxyl carrier protein
VASANPEPGSPERKLSDLTAAVRELGQIMRESGLHKLEIEDGHLSIRLLTAGGKVKYVAASSPLASDAFESEIEDEVELTPGQIVTSPMVGTYYASPAPGQPVFVAPGDRVQPGQTIGIIEAMKTMNEIPAGYSGVVGQLFVANAQAVEYGTPLLSIILDGIGA